MHGSIVCFASRFYIRDVSSLGFWYLQGSRNPSPMDAERQLRTTVEKERVGNYLWVLSTLMNL